MNGVNIAVENQPATFINIWSTASKENQRRLIAAMKLEMDEMTAKPGFISLTILPSLNGTRVVVYGQWRSRADFEAAVINDEQAMESRRRLSAFGEPSPGVYRVDSVFVSTNVRRD